MKRLRSRRLARFAANHGGATAVEFALIAPVFITFIFGIAYISIMLHTNSTLQWAVENTIRSAIINTSVTQSQLTTKLNGFLSQTGMPNASTVTYSVSTGAIPVATLTASFNRSFTIPFVGTFNQTYSATASMPQDS